MKITIAIDGPSGAGKASIAKGLAQHYQVPHIDTGLIYRFIAYLLRNNGVDVTNQSAIISFLSALYIDYRDIVLLKSHLISEEVGRRASVIAAISPLRQMLIAFQRGLAYRENRGAVIDGRDIGSVILPEAEFKFFITASLKVRALRRLKQLRAAGKNVMYSAVLYSLVRRDFLDANRSAAPLARAEDAIYISTDEAGLPEILTLMIKIVDQKINRGIND